MQTEAWEGQLVEAPVMVKRDGTYLVFYSANDYGSDQYAVGVASAPSITGPYVEAAGAAAVHGIDRRPLPRTRRAGRAVRRRDGDLIFFHGWNELFMYRGMHSAPLQWDGDVPTVRLP